MRWTTVADNFDGPVAALAELGHPAQTAVHGRGAVPTDRADEPIVARNSRRPAKSKTEGPSILSRFFILVS